MVGVTWKGARGRPSLPSRGCSQPPAMTEERRVSAPSVSFRDKIEYQDLFKPLPKPEPIPQLTSFKVNEDFVSHHFEEKFFQPLFCPVNSRFQNMNGEVAPPVPPYFLEDKRIICPPPTLVCPYFFPTLFVT